MFGQDRPVDHLFDEEEETVGMADGDDKTRLPSIDATNSTPHSSYRYRYDDEDTAPLSLYSKMDPTALSLLSDVTVQDTIYTMFGTISNANSIFGQRLSRQESYNLFPKVGTRFMYYGLNREERRIFLKAEDVIDFIKNECRTYGKQDKPNFDDWNENIPQFWIDCQDCSEDDISKFISYFGFHKTTADACASDRLEVSEKWEYFNEYLFSSVSVLLIQGETIDEVSVPEKQKKKFWEKKKEEFKPKAKYYPNTFLNIVLMDRCVLTFHDAPFHGYSSCLSRLERGYSKITGRVKLKKVETGEELQYEPTSSPSGNFSIETSPSFIFHSILNGIIEVFIPIVDNVSKDCDLLDEFALSFSSSYAGSTVITDIADFKRKLIILKKLLLPKQRMITHVVSHHLTENYIEPDVQLYLRNTLDHLTYCCEKLDIAVDSLNESHTNYLTKLQIEMSEASSSTDMFMNRLSALAVIYAPLAVIVSSLFEKLTTTGHCIWNEYESCWSRRQRTQSLLFLWNSLCYDNYYTIHYNGIET